MKYLNSMIFAVGDEPVLQIHESEEQVYMACEQIDVEEGVYRFWASDGTPLKVTFVTPIVKTKLLFITLIRGGEYRLQPTQGQSLQSFLDSQAYKITLEANSHFSTMEELKRHLNISSA